MGVYYGPRQKLLTSTVYTQSTRYPVNSAADWNGMNNLSASGVDGQTGTFNEANPWIMADCNIIRTVRKIVVGYDYLNNLAGGWGVGYTEGALVQVSFDAVTWTTVGTVPSYASSGAVNGLVSINVGVSTRYVRLAKTSNYLACTEFEVWIGV